MILPIFKPKGQTSNQVLTQIKKITGIKKVGHAGTLDPLAEGVLIVGIGRQSTKKLFAELQKEKEYEVLIEFGKVSTTDDEEGKKTEWKVTDVPKESEVTMALKKFTGKISQIPPLFSAVKVSGVESYKKARRGLAVKLKPRQVLIKKINLLEYNWPLLKLNVTTGPGVYIRSLTRDLGEILKVGGYVKELKRTRVGEFKIEDCLSPDSLKDIKFDTIKGNVQASHE